MAYGLVAIYHPFLTQDIYMARIAMKNIGGDSAKSFDTLALNGLKNGGVKIYVPKMVSSVTENGTIVFIPQKEHLPALKMVMLDSNRAPKTLYNLNWKGVLDSKWMHSSQLVTEIGIPAAEKGFASAVNDWLAAQNGYSSANFIKDGIAGRQNDLYIVIKTLRGGVEDDVDNRQYYSDPQPVSIAVSGINANQCEIRGVYMGSSGFLEHLYHYVSSNFEGGGSIRPDTDHWINDIFRPQDLVYQGRSLDTYIDKLDSGQIIDNPDSYTKDGYSTYLRVGPNFSRNWRKDESAPNYWYINTDDGNNAYIGNFMVFNLTVPANTTANDIDLSVQFILSNHGTYRDSLENPTDAQTLKLNHVTFGHGFGPEYSFADNNVEFTFAETGTKAITALGNIADGIPVTYTADTGWSFDNLRNVYSAVTAYRGGYLRIGSKFRLYADHNDKIDMDLRREGNSVYFLYNSDGFDIWGIENRSPSLPSDYVPAVIAVNIEYIASAVSAYDSTVQVIKNVGTVFLTIYRPLSDYISSYNPEKTYEDVFQDFNHNYWNTTFDTPVPYEYRIGPISPTGCTVQWKPSESSDSAYVTITGSSKANTAYTAYSYSKSITYKVSKAGYADKISVLTSEYLNSGYIDLLSTYTYTFTIEATNEPTNAVYTWSNGATGKSVTVDGVSAETYFLSVTASCEGYETMVASLTTTKTSPNANRSIVWREITTSWAEFDFDGSTTIPATGTTFILPFEVEANTSYFIHIETHEPSMLYVEDDGGNEMEFNSDGLDNVNVHSPLTIEVYENITPETRDFNVSIYKWDNSGNVIPSNLLTSLQFSQNAYGEIEEP